MTSKTKRENEQSWQPPSLLTSLPEDIIFDILAHVPRCEYPTLSLVSKKFRSLVASPEIYIRRSLLGNTEHCFYVRLYDATSRDCRWYILHRKANGKHRLVLVHSLPAMNHGASSLAVGSSIYVFGGEREDHTRDNVLIIDCRFHTVEHLPIMPVPTSNRISAIIDGKIYVIGDDLNSKKVMMVFNTEAKMWEPGMIKRDIDLVHTWFGCVVMDDRIYTKDRYKSVAYDPKEDKWETEEMLNSEWWSYACVVDDVLYFYDRHSEKRELRAYDSKKRCWGVVKGLEELLPLTIGSDWMGTARYGGKLALCFSKYHFSRGRTMEVCYGKVSLERRQGGEIWGKLECYEQVLIGENIHVGGLLAVLV